MAGPAWTGAPIGVHAVHLHAAFLGGVHRLCEQGPFFRQLLFWRWRRLNPESCVHRRVRIVRLRDDGVAGRGHGMLRQFCRAENEWTEHDSVNAAFGPRIEDALVIVHHAFEIAHYIHP